MSKRCQNVKQHVCQMSSQFKRQTMCQLCNNISEDCMSVCSSFVIHFILQWWGSVEANSLLLFSLLMFCSSRFGWNVPGAFEPSDGTCLPMPFLVSPFGRYAGPQEACYNSRFRKALLGLSQAAEDASLGVFQTWKWNAALLRMGIAYIIISFFKLHIRAHECTCTHTHTHMDIYIYINYMFLYYHYIHALFVYTCRNGWVQQAAHFNSAELRHARLIQPLNAWSPDP